MPPGALLLCADRRAVSQMLLNLLSNAVKFTLAGGRIGIRAAIRDSTHQFLSVEDNGVGISEADLQKLGNPFVQADNQPGILHTGTGLGLALVRALAEKHAGSMHIRKESRRWSGTIVTSRTADSPRSHPPPLGSQPLGSLQRAFLAQGAAQGHEN